MNETEDERLLCSAIKEHIPYELNMLEYAFASLEEADGREARNSCVPLRNAMIEAFWLHARNLVEFLNQPRNKTGISEGGTISARDLTTDGFNPETNLKEMYDRINNAITHLQYGRPSQPERKLAGYEMARTKDTLDREIKNFERALLPKYQKVWKRREQKSPWTILTLQVLSSTSTFTDTNITIDPANQ